MKILVALAAALGLSGCVTTQPVPYRTYPTYHQPRVVYTDYYHRQPICYWRSTVYGVVQVCR